MVVFGYCGEDEGLSGSSCVMDKRITIIQHARGNFFLFTYFCCISNWLDGGLRSAGRVGLRNSCSRACVPSMIFLRSSFGMCSTFSSITTSLVPCCEK